MSTPLMKQYAQVKAKYPDTILLFRMGDFFETFDEDAKIASRVLGITLTKRGNGAAGETPLAGFPHHALDAYLPKLLKAGHRVAVCEQLEDPKLAKGIVKRDVIEVVTPGVAFSDRILDQKQNNYLAAIALPHAIAGADDIVGFAFVDASTGEFSTGEFPFRHLAEQVASIAPSELLVQKRDAQSLIDLLKNSFSGLYTKIDDWLFERTFGYDLLLQNFNTKTLKGFGVDEFGIGITAAGAVMHYLQETQKHNLLHIRKISPFTIEGYIVLDAPTKRNLEIASSADGTQEGSLFGVLDRTQTPMGSRMLKRWIGQPLNVLESIIERLDAVDELAQTEHVRRDAGMTLARIADLERLNMRICTGRATPRDLVALRGILQDVERLRTILAPVNSSALTALRAALHPLYNITELVERSIEPEPPATLADGGVIRTGYNAELDELRSLAFSGKRWIADLQKSERERTGIGSLKVGFNNVFGYYIEVTNSHKEKVPQDYIRKQTLTGAERYVTPGLKEQEEKILHAEERLLALETSLFNEIRLAIAAHAAEVLENARAIATLDCFIAFAGCAIDYDYVRPEVNMSSVLEIAGGRHPVIERLLPPGEAYVPNDVRLSTDAEQILIITGPNMSGKSSFLRQTGLIVLLAQVGSFVPAQRASIGIVDKIFTRVGASDRITTGESTFLVEMHEAAHIVNTATQRSLILLDEVGRGTSTFDGISIAWALTEYLHDHVGARTLFATHYHELNELADLFPRIRNYKVDVREYDDKVIFLHKVNPGFADHSYGIQVAQMAGLPSEVTDRAKDLLTNLERTGLSLQGEDTGNGRRKGGGRVAPASVQLTLFEAQDDAVHTQLRSLDVNALTPLKALEILAQLKEKVS
ncbi:MAG TPA: DNA mismatch repair protein MutS [Bacteroidota bacterium]|nr:DNA mismatch repair protein MutS [Bacteroidota bacterium]